MRCDKHHRRAGLRGRLAASGELQSSCDTTRPLQPPNRLPSLPSLCTFWAERANRVQRGQLQSSQMEAVIPFVAGCAGRSSMDQSWGSSSLRQVESSKPVSCALGASPRRNSQPSSKEADPILLAVAGGCERDFGDQGHRCNGGNSFESVSARDSCLHGLHSSCRFFGDALLGVAAVGRHGSSLVVGLAVMRIGRGG